MALQKTVSTQYGINATYWKIVRMEIDWLNSKCFCRVSGWKDNASRLVPDEALDHRVYDWSGDDFNFSHTFNNTEIAYDKMRVMEEWGGATNV